MDSSVERKTADGATHLERLRALDACAMSDALDTLGLPGVVRRPRRLWSSKGVVAGLVRTVQAGPRREDGPAGHIAATAVDSSGPDHVLVIANGGDDDVSCWGGLLSLAAAGRGIAGVVVDGACRDITESEELAFPVFAVCTVPTSARGRILQLDMDCTVVIDGVSVAPGDYVVADATGVAFVPGAHIDELLAAAERVVRREAGMARSVRSGRKVAEVMHDTQFSDDASP